MTNLRLATLIVLCATGVLTACGGGARVAAPEVPAGGLRTVIDTTPIPLPGGGSSVGDDIDTTVIYSHGPMKLMMPEQLLAAVSTLTGHDFGSYDFTTPATANSSDFAQFCTSLGGCPDHVSTQRNISIGTVYSLSLDKLVSAACREDANATGMIPPNVAVGNANPTMAEIDAAITWQYQRFFDVMPRPDELDVSRTYFTTHLGRLDADTGQPTGEADAPDFGTALRGHCMALLSSSKFLFY